MHFLKNETVVHFLMFKQQFNISEKTIGFIEHHTIKERSHCNENLLTEDHCDEGKITHSIIH